MTGSESERREPRRVHRKSRNGCLICKQRRVKCDERRPICGNCAVRDRPCSYAPRPSETLIDPSLGAVSTPASVSSGSRAVENSGSGRSAFSEVHMVLLHHAERDLGYIMAIEGAMGPILDIAVDSASTSPFLLHQLLAISALHLSSVVQEEDRKSFYHHHATNLQTRALEMFNEAKEGISDHNYLPSFLFATLLGIHVLRETLKNQDQGLGNFVSAFVSYAHLHRGVRAVIAGYWPEIQESDLKPLLYIVQHFNDADTFVKGTETRGLQTFFESNDEILSSAAKVSLEALDWVQWMIDVRSREPTRPDVAINAVLSWPCIISDNYIDALYQRRPEAIIVLAYYAALMHKHRTFWIFGNAGSSLVQLIALHLGPFWNQALAWPLQVLRED